MAGRPLERAGDWCSSCHSGNGAARSAVALAEGGGEIGAAPGRRERDMGLFDRMRGRTRRGTLDRGSDGTDVRHLEQFVATRRGVEGYVEPWTAVTETTIVLVAADGEWTRRRIEGPDTARRLSRELAIPVYDAQVTGYPQRMRDWSARRKKQ
jgi:hypothetical protein